MLGSREQPLVEDCESSQARLRSVGLLAGWEALALVRHPVLVGAAAMSAFLAVSSAVAGAVVWQTQAAMLGGHLLPLVVASFLVSTWRASRQRRYRTEEFLDSLPEVRSVRVISYIGAAAAPIGYSLAILTAVLVVGMLSNPAGRLSGAELLAGPVVVAIGWVAGLLLGGGLGRLRFLAPLVLMGYAFLQLLASPDVELGTSLPSERDPSRLLLWHPPSAFDTPFEVLLRPSGLRLAYLGAVLFFLLALTVRRGTKARLLVWTVRGAMALALPLSVGLAYLVVNAEPTAGWGWNSPIGLRVDWEQLTDRQTCQITGDVSYCAYPGFEPWIPEWQSVIEATASTVPRSLREGDVLRVVQRPERSAFPGSEVGAGGVVTSFAWDRPGTRRPVEGFKLALRSVRRLLGRAPGPADRVMVTQDHASSVVTLWAAATSVERGSELLEQLARDTGGSFGEHGISVDAATAEVALQISNLAVSDVIEVLDQNAAGIQHASTPVIQLVEWFQCAGFDVGPPRVEGAPVARCG